jgi:hypothetical protein
MAPRRKGYHRELIRHSTRWPRLAQHRSWQPQPRRPAHPRLILGNRRSQSSMRRSSWNGSWDAGTVDSVLNLSQIAHRCFQRITRLFSKILTVWIARDLRNRARFNAPALLDCPARHAGALDRRSLRERIVKEQKEASTQILRHGSGIFPRLCQSGCRLAGRRERPSEPLSPPGPRISPIVKLALFCTLSKSHPVSLPALAWDNHDSRRVGTILPNLKLALFCTLSKSHPLIARVSRGISTPSSGLVSRGPTGRPPVGPLCSPSRPRCRWLCFASFPHLIPALSFHSLRARRKPTPAQRTRGP